MADAWCTRPTMGKRERKARGKRGRKRRGAKREGGKRGRVIDISRDLARYRDTVVHRPHSPFLLPLLHPEEAIRVLKHWAGSSRERNRK